MYVAGAEGGVAFVEGGRDLSLNHPGKRLLRVDAILEEVVSKEDDAAEQEGFCGKKDDVEGVGRYCLDIAASTDKSRSDIAALPLRNELS